MITSTNNSKIKLVRSLQGRRRTRSNVAAFIAEGVRLVEEAVSVQWPMAFILYDETLSTRGQELIADLKHRSVAEVIAITPQLMSDISDTETPQGILAVLERKLLPLPNSPTFVVIADQIRDSGNMGTLLRTAEAAGADAFLLSSGTVDAFSPKVIRAGMGAHFHLPIQNKPWQEMQTYLKGLAVILADSAGGIPMWEVDMRQPCALLIGGEAFGASRSGEAFATQRVTIPMRGRTESLNAAIAAGILIAEVLRQRYDQQKD